MESLQGSWQYENLSSAEFTLSPPISPAPPLSPTLYSFNLSTGSNVDKLGVDFVDFESNLANITLSSQNDVEGVTFDEFNQQLLGMPIKGVNPFINENSGASLTLIPAMITAGVPIISSAQPKNVQHIPSGKLIEQINTNFSLSMDDDLLEWNDEKSYNLELFEDIGDLNNSQVLLQDELQPESPPVKQFVSGVNTDIKSPGVPEVVIQQKDLLDSFQEIIQELGLNVIESIPGVVSSFNYSNEFNELGNEGEDLGLINGSDSMMEADDDQDGNSTTGNIGNGSPHSTFGEVVIVTEGSENQLTCMEDSVMSDSSSYYFISNPSSVSNSDDEDDAQEMVLDALVCGDYETAASINLSVVSARLRPAKSSKLSNELRENTSDVAKKLALLKPEKRGRKPSSAASGKSWVNLTDKGLRKKEQNKTAATRYRQKKKMETLYSLEREQELQTESEQLNKDKDDLAKQIKMMKELLRELFSAKKGQQFKRKLR